MIVPMRKIYLVARRTDRQSLLEVLGEAGVVHLAPIDPERAVPDEAVSREIDAIQQAHHFLSGVKPKGRAPTITPGEAAHEVLAIERRAVEERNRLASLHHQLEQLEIWGDLRLDDVIALKEMGVDIRFYALAPNLVQQVQAECVAVVGTLPGRLSMVAVADRRGEIVVPDEAEPVQVPLRDTFAIRAEGKECDDVLHHDIERLHQLAHLTTAMEDELRRLERRAEETIAIRGAHSDEHLFAVQGWLPKDGVSVLEEKLSQFDVAAVFETNEPDDGEQPPTLVQPPAWARPIEGLFSILGTVPGYREFDVAIPFLIALPIFTAMLISDAGYGALLLLGPALSYSWTTKRLGARFTQLLMIVGAVSIVWGTLTNAFFGFRLLPVTLIPIELTEESRRFMMELSFLIGAIHLSIAQLWQAIRYYPNLQSLNKLGWALFIWGMYGVVRMFVLQGPLGWGTPWPYLLISGAALAIALASPDKNIVKMIAVGLARFPLSMLSAFSDVISYVRLMAVGLASSVLAVNFNEMALEAGFLPLTIVVLVLGHGLNVGLAMIAMFAHGVRLNMLEFGSNLGMQWAGYAYRPFVSRAE